MSVAAVARKDFRDAVRSRVLWVLTAIFVLLAVGVAAAYASFPAELAGGDTTASGLAFFLANTVGGFVAIAAILTCYKSIAGERESGSIKLTLALPHSRRDVVLGKVLGRTGVLAVPVVGSTIVGAALGSVLIGAVAPLVLVGLTVATLLFVVTYVAVMVGLSAMTGSSARAAALTVGFFVVFELMWEIVTIALIFVTSGFSLPNPAAWPAWVFLVNQVPPTSAFLTTLTALLPDAAGGVSMGPSAGGIDAFFGTPWIGAVSLLVWLIVPLVIGLWRFERVDL